MVEYRFATEEQIGLAMDARRIMEKELKPRIEDLEHGNDGKGEFPVDVMKTMAQAGYFAMDIPEKWGGLGLDTVTQCIIQEEMSKVDAGFTFNLNGAGMNWEYIENSHIPEADKQAWADKMLAGEATGAFCFTEPQAGSDAAAIRTTAVQDGDEWVINGNKCFVTNGPLADYFIVAAWTDKSVSAGKGVTLFFVEKERGVQVGSMENKMGIKLSVTSDIIFDNVRVPSDHIVGEIGGGFKEFMRHMDLVRVKGMIYALGIAQAAIDYAAEYATTRNAFGKPIIKHQGLAFLLADMQIRTEASRAILYEGARLYDEGRPLDSMLASASKVFVSENAVQTALDAVQVLGGYGFMKDYPVEKLVRDSKIFTIFDGTTQIQKEVIGRALAKKYAK